MMKLAVVLVISFLVLPSLPTVSMANQPGLVTDETGTENFRVRMHVQAIVPEYTADDIEAEIIFGRELASKVLAKYPPLMNDGLNAYVNQIGQLLALGSARPELQYHFVILDTDEVNAFAAPGGYVFITKGAISQARNEAEVAAILAHEMGHIEHRHYVKAIGLRGQQQGAEQSLAAIISGGGAAAVTAFNQAVNQAMEILFEKGLQSKEDEFEADAASVLLLATAGYQPTALKHYFKTIQQTRQLDLQLLSTTHPPFNERIDALTALIAELDIEEHGFVKLERRFNENFK